jgi:hypothetical protein
MTANPEVHKMGEGSRVACVSLSLFKMKQPNQTKRKEAYEDEWRVPDANEL